MRHVIHLSTLALALAFVAPASGQSLAQGIAPTLATGPNAPQLSVTDSAVSADAAKPVRVDVAPAAPVGASLTGLRVGVHSRETARPDQPNVVTSQHMGQDKAMMVVGVAALITGAIIGGTPGTIVMVGGAVVGLMGLYNYMQ